MLPMGGGIAPQQREHPRSEDPHSFDERTRKRVFVDERLLELRTHALEIARVDRPHGWLRMSRHAARGGILELGYETGHRRHRWTAAE
jgi:hypothetical protein